MIKRQVAAVVMSLALLGGACGGGEGRSGAVASLDGKQSSSKGTSPTKRDPQDALLAYAKCMRANGVDMPDPDPSGMVRMQPGSQPPDDEAMKRADAACKAEREALQGSMGEESKDFQDKALKMSRCMREQGVDMPDPRMSEDGKAAVEINPDQVNSPEFKKAEEICRKQVGFGEPGGGAGGGK